MGSGDWLLVGADGQLGRDLRLCLALEGSRLVVALTRADLDITDRSAVHDVIVDHRPKVVINAAAWNAVDLAEKREEDAFAVNAFGPGHIAEACRKVGGVLLHVSTDYVFGAGSRLQRPWREDDPVSPGNAYARSKAAGEDAVLRLLPDRGYVVRTAWLYSAHRTNFALTMLARARAGEPARVVRDQWGQPTWARDLADQLIQLAQRACAGSAPSGIYHGTNAGRATWWEFARWIYSLAGADPGLVSPQSSAAIDRPAARPTWSVLDHGGWAAAGLKPMRPWQEALVTAMPSLVRAPLTVA